MDTVKRHGATLLPIDSEHSAIFQCLPEDRASWPDRVDSLLLTASGGPFRLRDPATLSEITPEQACAHRSEEHTSELQSQSNLVCRLLLEKKKRLDWRKIAVQLVLTDAHDAVPGMHSFLS